MFSSTSLKLLIKFVMMVLILNLDNMELQTRFVIFRSSCTEVFFKNGVLKNFAKFAGKHFCQSLLFNKIAGYRPSTLLKKRLCHMCFSVKFLKFLRTPFL